MPHEKIRPVLSFSEWMDHPLRDKLRLRLRERSGDLYYIGYRCAVLDQDLQMVFLKFELDDEFFQNGLCDGLGDLEAWDQEKNDWKT